MSSTIPPGRLVEYFEIIKKESRDDFRWLKVNLEIYPSLAHVRLPSGELPLRVLLERGASPGVFVGLAAHRAQHDIMTASAAGEPSVVEQLLHENPDLVRETDGHGNTPLHWAVLGCSQQDVDGCSDEDEDGDDEDFTRSQGLKNVHVPSWLATPPSTYLSSEDPNLPILVRVFIDMHADLIQSKFEKLGARARIRPLVRNRWRSVPRPVVIDIGHDRRGEFFDIQVDATADVEVLDVQPRDRHLLLMLRQPNKRPGEPDSKDKFLCGHDERHWFVAGLPERASVSTVVTAKEALKPDIVRDREQGQRGKHSKRLRRKTSVFLRQGEWFFILAHEVRIDDRLILTGEPIRRGRGKPHMCEELYRQGGTTVRVCGRYQNGLTTEEYRKLLKAKPDAAKWNWRTMARDPVVYVRGRVWHPDHATIRLDVWHRVEMNTEHRSRAMASVAFLD